MDGNCNYTDEELASAIRIVFGQLHDMLSDARGRQMMILVCGPDDQPTRVPGDLTAYLKSFQLDSIVFHPGYQVLITRRVEF